MTPSDPVVPETGAEFLLKLLWKQSLVMYPCLLAVKGLLSLWELTFTHSF